MRNEAKLLQLRAAIQKVVANLPEEEALTISSVYPKWTDNSKAYKTNDYVTYGENSVGDAQLYRCLQDHTSSAEWTPEAAPSLWKKCGVNAEGVAVWCQPVGAMDAYNTDDIVEFDGKLYKSIIDNNVWSPAVYPAGWTLVDAAPVEEEKEEKEETPSASKWVQPVGAADAYKKGDIVTYNGVTYISNTDNNVWAPGVYGWDVYEA